MKPEEEDKLIQKFFAARNNILKERHWQACLHLIENNYNLDAKTASNIIKQADILLEAFEGRWAGIKS